MFDGIEEDKQIVSETMLFASCQLNVNVKRQLFVAMCSDSECFVVAIKIYLEVPS